MTGETRKSIVQETYDREADRYKTASAMQLFNLERLISLAGDSITQLKIEKILDIGCGLGPAAGVLKKRGLLENAEYLGSSTRARASSSPPAMQKPSMWLIRQ